MKEVRATSAAGIGEIMRVSPVIPVLTLHDLSKARGIAEALVAGGLRVLEVTLRTPSALEIIQALRDVNGAIVGAGTVLNASQLDDAISAGAQFAVSPGLTEPLAARAVDGRIPYLPGVATAGDIMLGLDLGLSHFKFFPAETSGGIPTLKALSAPFANVRFCPTGGVREGTAPSWLALPQVLCVGGSWLVPSGPPDFNSIEAAARRAASFQSNSGEAA
jgi:2-dehydro-3-deoxyphosphogluconate aldolase / (4S)-4-hydroxy-2-oxoglutarate aldolase